MRNIRELLAANIRKYRRQKSRPDGRSWSIEDLAQASGVSKGAIQKIESAAVWPDWSTLEKLALALSIGADDLFDMAEPMEIAKAVEMVNEALGSTVALALNQNGPSARNLKDRFDSDFLTARLKDLSSIVDSSLKEHRSTRNRSSSKIFKPATNK